MKPRTFREGQRVVFIPNGQLGTVDCYWHTRLIKVLFNGDDTWLCMEADLKPA